MAYDEALAERLRDLLAGEPVTEKRMFGGLAFLLGGHLAVAASGQGGLMVRVDPGTVEQLMAEPGTSEFEMQGRVLTGWLRVSADALADDDALDVWVRRGLAFCAALPAKSA